jgi:predicted nucleic acid-binding protein
MELVVDANILFAALIKVSATSDLIVDNSLNLVSVEFIFEEFEKYKSLIKEKTERAEEEFDRFMEIIQKKIKLIPYEEFKSFIAKAEKISPDPKDTEYLALALKLNCILWSNDKKLKTQDKVKVYSTEDLMNELKK